MCWRLVARLPELRVPLPAGGCREVSTEKTIRVKKWGFDVPAEELFVFSPAAGARKVDSFIGDISEAGV